MKQFLTALLLIISTNVFSQSDDEYWAKWNKNYPEQNIPQMLRQEKLYADSIEKHPDIAPYYIRNGSYRFDAQYLGKVRPIDKNTSTSIKNVFKLTKGDPSMIDALLQNEVLFKVDDEEIWMPIQPQILAALNEEAKPGDKIKLYCAYFNEHTSKGVLYNTFLISEFSK